MSVKAFRRWLLPGAVAASMIVPLLIGGCFEEEELPFWYGMPGCEYCTACYDALTGRPPPTDSPGEMPEELRFDGDPPTGSRLENPGGEVTGSPEDDTANGGDETSSRKTPRTRPTGIPDGVLRPRPDHPDLPDMPVRRDTPSVPSYPGTNQSNPNHPN